LRGSEFSLGDFGAKFLPLPKLIGEVLWRFCFLDRSTTARLHFFLEDESHQADYDRSTALRISRTQNHMVSARRGNETRALILMSAKRVNFGTGHCRFVAASR
jgi:hypothetical protein